MQDFAEWRNAHKQDLTFNSLFEMPQSHPYVRRHAALQAFNSLFEMLDARGKTAAGLLLTMSFNSLFEMQEGVRRA